jgi:cation/acetate symporter
MTGTAEAAADRAGSPALAGLSAAGRAVPVALLASLPGLVFLAGFDHLAFGLGLLAGIVLSGNLIAPEVARTGAPTMTGALERRFGRGVSFAAAAVGLLVMTLLLAAELTLLGLVAEAGLHVPYLPAILAALALTAAGALLLSDRAFGWLAAGACIVFAAGLAVPLVLMALKGGAVPPYVGYGHVLSAIGCLEERFVENGVVDFDTFSMHVTPFLRLSGLDLVALVVSLALGTAVLPPLVSALAAGRDPACARLAGAWTALFAMLVLIAVPALAAYAKLEIYGTLVRETSLTAVPGWLEAPLRAGVARLHGTSVYLLAAVADAVRAGHADAAAVSGYLVTDARAAAQWAALDERVREALLASARTLADGQSAASLWDVYRASVLPAAAAAAGNATALLTQAALVMEPAGLLLALPGLAGAPAWAAPAPVLATLAAALVMAVALLRGLLPVTAVGGSGRWRAGALLLATGALAAGLAAARPGDLVTIVVAALSLAAAGVFPALAVGLAWKRATAAGAMAAILLGGGLTLYYEIGIQVFPAAFYRTWAPLSNAGAFAVEEFAALEADAREAADGQAKTEAEAAREALARGTATRRGLANWFGIDSASGAIFGVPLGLAALLLVSLLTRPRRVSPHP